MATKDQGKGRRRRRRLLGFVDKDLLLVRARVNPAGRQSELITIESISESPPPFFFFFYYPSPFFRTSFASEEEEEKKMGKVSSSLIKPFMSFRTDLSIPTEKNSRRRGKKEEENE
jgi:hypothetical protein